MPTIIKIHLENFKRFRNYTIETNPGTNILVGDNEVGKSTVLDAIDLVSCGSRHRIESIGFDKLLCQGAVDEFNAGERKYENLPRMRVELYFSEGMDPDLNGENNTEKKEQDGIRLICEPIGDLQKEITAVLEGDKESFPYDYYDFRFTTFAGEPFTGRNKKIRSVIIDSSNMSSVYAMNDFVQRMYAKYTKNDKNEQAALNNMYRSMRESFAQECLSELNGRILVDDDKTEENDGVLSFGLKNGSAMSLDGDLMIYEDKVGMDSKGTGRQVYIKTDFALRRAGDNLDVVLMEEPENHLSPVNLRRLVKMVEENTAGMQLFVATHSSYICARLELNNVHILHESGSDYPVSLTRLNKDTAEFFKKAPPAGLIEFALSSKAILVEGPSEYMLFEKFYNSCVGHAPEKDNVNIIDIRGLSFKRYLEIAKLTGAKVAVVTDNDGDPDKKINEKYSDFFGIDNIKIFYEENMDAGEAKVTFEDFLFECNENLCKELFAQSSNPLEHMKSNKTESAYTLLCQNQEINVPGYIQRAIRWISN